MLSKTLIKTFSILTLFISSLTIAQSIQGQWTGVLTQKGTKFNFYLDIRQIGDQLTGGSYHCRCLRG